LLFVFERMSPRQLQARDLLIRIDRSLGARMGRQLEQQLRDAIRSGALLEGAELPSTRALAEDLGVSRGVVVRAYAQLAGEGYISLRQGANPRVRGFTAFEAPRVVAHDQPGKARVRYDLRAHLPEVSAFPRQAWLRSTRDSLSRASKHDLSYLEPSGLTSLRLELASYLGRARGVVPDPERIVITAGATHALSLIGSVLSHRGSTRMAFENPSHLILHAVATAAGQTPVGVPVDADGLVVSRIGEAGAVVVSPAHQFPTGVALSADRRAELLGWSRDTGCLVIEDDYDAEFRYDRAPIGSLQGLSPEHVAYIGSTGKTLAPAIRLGWAVLPPSLVEPVAEKLARSLLHISGIDQLAFTDFLRRGEFDRHLRRMRTIYRRRRDVVVDALATHLPELRIAGIAAGLHVVVELPSAEAEAAASARAHAAGVLVQTLSQHALPGYNGPTGLLIGYGSLPEPTLRAAVERLASAINPVLEPRGRRTRSLSPASQSS
jgi:GntR family transcriptional regulator/MocR family aminotransferase